MSEDRELVSSSPSDPKWFRQVLGQYPTGVCVVTAQEPGEKPSGMAVGSFTSVSLDPPLVAFLPDRSSSSWPKIERATKFCVNILGAEQEHVCRRFASKVEDKFEELPYRLSENGSPIIEQCVAWIDCDLHSVQEAGDHYIVIGKVRELKIESAGLPLLFFQGGYGRFSPLSMVVPDPLGKLVGPLRSIDKARSDMEWVSDHLSARCLATARVEEVLIIAASAGCPKKGTVPTLVGQRLPFMPPTGSIFAAWSCEEEINEWLRLAGSPERRAAFLTSLATIRARGYSLGLISEAHRTFASTLDQLSEDPDAVASIDVRELVQNLNYDPVELTPDIHREVRQISVPVFGHDGVVAYVLTLYDFPAPQGPDGVMPYITQMKKIAEKLTHELGGPTVVIS